MTKPLSQTPNAIATRKWRANNPDASKASSEAYRVKNPLKVRSAIRQWQLDHMDESNVKQRAYRARKKIEKLTDRRSKSIFTTRKFSEPMKAEVRRHISKGRDVGTIAVWMNQPVSFVQSVIASL